MHGCIDIEIMLYLNKNEVKSVNSVQKKGSEKIF